MVPTNQMLIDAPVIFSGIATEMGEKEVATKYHGQQTYRYARFKVTHMYKGPDRRYLDLLIVRPGYAAKIGEEVTLIPSVSESGDMSISVCSIGLRTEKYWVGKVKNAYATPFPNLYLKMSAFISRIHSKVIKPYHAYMDQNSFIYYWPYVVYFGTAAFLFTGLIFIRIRKSNGRAR